MKRRKKNEEKITNAAVSYCYNITSNSYEYYSRANRK